MTRLAPFYWANEASRAFQAAGYLEPHETTEGRVREMARHAFVDVLKMDEAFAEEFYDYAAQGCYSFASPVWSNFGRHGLPISCNGTYVGDSIESMMKGFAEIGIMTKHGAGTSAYFGDIRPRGAKISTMIDSAADGPMHFIPMWDQQIDIISQGSMRRGNMGAYMKIEHPQIMEFLEEVQTHGHGCNNLHPGVTITDDWMREMLAGDEAKQGVWARLVRKRYETGYPYVVFIDNANAQRPDVYKMAELLIHASNLCTEIMLPSSETESFVCCLSSMNLSRFDFWQNTRAVELMIFFLDAVMEEYIQKTEGMYGMERANRFARRHRALGLGVLGYHTALMELGIPMESMEAKFKNTEWMKFIKDRAVLASRELALNFGEPELMEGTDLRNATLLAIAPTKSSSFIAGQVSEGIEPVVSHYGTKNLAKGKFTLKTPALVKYLEERGHNTDDVWQSILRNNGSVQHLPENIIDAHAKQVFKIFAEIGQLELVQQAAARQKFVCQGQSLNLMVHPKTPAKEVSQLMIAAWNMGIKSLYYQKGQNLVQELTQSLMSCAACEG